MRSGVTDHAVERFIQRWRPSLSVAEARRELETLVEHAVPTRQKTLPGDAWLYTTMSPAGERILLAVRDGIVLTVLDPRTGDGKGQDLGIDPSDPMLLESASVREQCAAILRQDVVAQEKALRLARAAERTARDAKIAADVLLSRRRGAEETIAAWKTGAKVKPSTLKRARDVLALTEGFGKLSIEGGRYDGVCVEIEDGETVEAVIARLRAAMEKV